MDSLDLDRELGGYDLDSVAFCARKDYSPICEKRISKSYGDIAAKIENAMEVNEAHMQKIVSEKNRVLLRIHLLLGEENTLFAVSADPQQTLREVFGKVAGKRGVALRPEDFQFRVYHDGFNVNETADRVLNYKDESNLNCLDMRLPIKELKSSELLLASKYFVDSPGGRRRAAEQDALDLALLAQTRTIAIRKQQAMCTVPVPAADEDVKEEEILLNEVSATTYKAGLISSSIIGVRSAQDQRTGLEAGAHSWPRPILSVQRETEEGESVHEQYATCMR